MKSKTIAVDLAKNVFEVGVSERPGHVKKTVRLSRAKFLSFFVDQSPARVVMEAAAKNLELAGMFSNDSKYFETSSFRL